VIGNGDVFLPEDALRMHRQTGCDGVMIGRAASSNPWIFRQIEQYVATGSYDQPSELDRYHMIRDYYRMLMERPDKISGDVCGKMKQFATYFSRGVRNGAQMRKRIYQCHTPEDVTAAVDAFFEESLANAA
jgi:tRNA-dihydrouridine synthase